jgi:hypothetical protein
MIIYVCQLTISLSLLSGIGDLTRPILADACLEAPAVSSFGQMQQPRLPIPDEPMHDAHDHDPAPDMRDEDEQTDTHEARPEADVEEPLPSVCASKGHCSSFTDRVLTIATVVEKHIAKAIRASKKTTEPAGVDNVNNSNTKTKEKNAGDPMTAWMLLCTTDAEDNYRVNRSFILGHMLLNPYRVVTLSCDQVGDTHGWVDDVISVPLHWQVGWLDEPWFDTDMPIDEDGRAVNPWPFKLLPQLINDVVEEMPEMRTLGIAQLGFQFTDWDSFSINPIAMPITQVWPKYKRSSKQDRITKHPGRFNMFSDY